MNGRRRPPVPEGPYLVVGLARSGLAAATLLRERGEVIACDIGVPELPDGLEGIEIELDSDGLDLLERARTVVKSPGVPREAAVIAAARERGIEVVGELELGWRALPEPRFLAVTGTNGKTTTSELLGMIHREAGIEVEVAGNVGTPLCSLVGTGAPAAVVCECSSFQLEDAPGFAPECALLLNLEPDHIDRHGSFEDYRAAKLSMFARQEAADLAIAPAGLDPGGAGTRIVFGGPGSDLELRDGELLWHDEPVIAVSEIRIRGAHNVANAMGAASAALASGIDRDAVRRALRGFAGVDHRLEEVAEVDGVLYVNDSKATNVASASVGLAAFAGGVHAILGGSLKGGDFAGLRIAVESRCRAVYLIGEAAGALARDLEGTAPIELCGELGVALERASAAALPGEVVLLSPATASFDQFRDYEQRGECFRVLVGELSERFRES